MLANIALIFLANANVAYGRFAPVGGVCSILHNGLKTAVSCAYHESPVWAVRVDAPLASKRRCRRAGKVRKEPKLQDAALYLNGHNALRAVIRSVALYLGKFGGRSIAARYMQVLSLEDN